jgi:hypothetical protein
MNRQQFFDWMNDPATLNSESVADLQQLTADYPYFQTARLLHLINLKLLQDYRFEESLRQVAAYAADRSQLREWLGLIDEIEKKESKLDIKSEKLHQSPADILKDNQLKELEEQIKTSLDEIELKKSRLRELIEEKKAIVGSTDTLSEEFTENLKGYSLRPLPKDKMLEEFIQQQQEQSQIRVTFYNPEESARRSIEENDGILSETLARLIAAQGKKDKAIKIYQKLMLKNPQKSSYFAAQIEKLRKEP